MTEGDWLAERFEANRAHLRGVAYRILGSLPEAEDALQESWLRLSRADVGGVQNIGGWLTTVVGRVCLDMLRSRKSRNEEPAGDALPEPFPALDEAAEPEREAVLADSVGLALLVVLEKLTPTERLAFVLHDMFAVPFDEIAPIVGRSEAAARQLASRARRRVQGSAMPPSDRARQREIVDAFLAASREGNFEALMTLLDPDVVLRVDRFVGHAHGPDVHRGAEAVARGASAARGRARYCQAALIDGKPGVVMAPAGRLRVALTFSIVRGKITELDITGDPERLRHFDFKLIDDAVPAID